MLPIYKFQRAFHHALGETTSTIARGRSFHRAKDRPVDNRRKIQKRCPFWGPLRTLAKWRLIMIKESTIVASWLGAALTWGVDLTLLQKEAEAFSEDLSVL